ncbi:MAG: histone [Candidatus Heimdallarchaeota archaeon]
MSARRSKTEMPLAPIESIIRETTEMRVSDKGARELRRILTEIAEELAEDAAEYSKFAGRQTIKDRDIALAYRSMRKQR